MILALPRTWRALAWAAAAALLVVACSAPPSDDGDGPANHAVLQLRTDAAIAAGQVTVELPSGAALEGVVALRSGLLWRSATVGQRVHVAWIGEDAEDGDQLRFTFAAPLALEGLEVAAAAGFASVTAEDVGADAFTLVPADGTPAFAEATPVLVAADAHVELQPGFAAHPLGDLNADGVVDVRDTLLLRDRLRDGGWSDFERYSGDVDADDALGLDDLALLLERLVDASLPPRLHVKPRALPFVRLDPGAEGPGLVLVANTGSVPFPNLTWELPDGAVAADAGGLPGWSRALQLSLPLAGRVGWLPGHAMLRDGAGGEASVRLGHIVVLIAGQSNASGFGDPLVPDWHVPDPNVRMLANDYRWRDASEPLHAAGARYSFGTRLGELLLASTGYEVALVPTAVPGTGVESWMPGPDPLDTSTLFGAANFRGQVAAGRQANPQPDQPYPAEGGPVNVVVWYQGEYDAVTSGRRSAFIGRTNEVMDGFRDELGATAVAVQLASHHEEPEHVRQHAIAELQRRMETGFGPDARNGFHLVVAFDLPRSDHNHLSAYAHRVLAERIELAIRQHVLGEAVDGTGPRLTGITHSSSTIRVRTTHVLADEPLNPKLFTVFNGAPSGSLNDYANYGQNTIAITAVARDPSDPTAVLLTLASAPTDTPHVRYMGEPNLRPARDDPDPSDVWDVFASGIVRANEGGLPLPAFGPLSPF